MQLRDYQKHTIQFGLSRDRSVLALDCGLGKSLCALEVAKNILGEIIIVCPASLKSNWANELQKWGLAVPKFTILSYEMFVKFVRSNENEYGMIVFDECHSLRNPGTQRAGAVESFLKKFKGKVIFLTATPVINGANDLYNLLKWCLGKRLRGTYWEFCKEHCLSKTNRFSKSGIAFYGVKHISVLKDLFKQCGIRFKKEEVLKDLPERVDVEVSLDVGDFRLNEEEKKDLQHWLEHGRTKGRSLPKHLSVRQQEVSSKKIKALAELYGDLDRCVYFFWYRANCEKFGKSLENCEVITGKIPVKQRAEIIENFQSGKINRLAVTIASTGVGVNLFNGKHAVFAEYSWSFADLEQARGRLHRIGNTGCTIFYPVCVNSIEETQWKVVKQKESYGQVC